ncbi:MAG: PIN domain-containing protein [Nanoarchaeota archaeon]
MNQFILLKKEKINSLNQKIGLNSNILVYLISYPIIYKKQLEKIFNNKGVFYIHALSLKKDIEIQKVLKRDYSYKEKEIKSKIKDFLKKRNIEIVPINKEKRELAREREKICNENNISIHPPDSIIISDFVEHGITKVFSEDGTFVRASNFIGLPAEQILFKFDKKIQKELGKLKHFKIN